MSDSVVITFKAPQHLAEALEDYAEREGVSKSEVIREALKRLLRHYSLGVTAWHVKRVVLSPPSDEVNDWAGVPPVRRPTCEEVAEARKTMSWAEVADMYGFNSKYTARNWFKRVCEGRR